MNEISAYWQLFRYLDYFKNTKSERLPVNKILDSFLNTGA